MIPANPARRAGRARPNISNSSWMHSSPSTIRATVKTMPPAATMTTAKMIAGIATAMRLTRSEPVLRRAARVVRRSEAVGRRRRGAGGTSAPSEAPGAGRELVERLLERLARVVGPQLVAEDELRVGRLPEQEVGHALLAAGPHDDVRVVHLGRVEERAQRLLPAAGVALRGVDDLRAPAVVEGHEERDPVVGRGLGLGPVHLLQQRRGDTLPAADEPHPHALALELGRLEQDPLGEHPHQRGHLLRGARPVLGGERVDGELPDAELDGVAQPRLDDVRARAVPLLDGETSRLRPAAVAIGDDGDVARRAGHTSRISSSLALRCDSSSAILPSVSFWSSCSPRRSSSAPTSPSSLRPLRSCMMSRRTLRIATRPSSARWRTTFTSSLRRSSLSSGIARRISRPSLLGVSPTSDSMIAFSMALIDDWSNGCTVMRRASGTLMVASCLSGVCAP